MLEKIASSYFTKIVLAYVNEKKKLKLVRFNKSLQGKINISIINYIHFKEKYKKYESNGKGKEYDRFDRLVFEGEYINGERNGKGKEYDYNGDIKFDGEYLNGERNGKGKEYLNGNLRFECEYLKGKKNGKGKEYWYWYNSTDNSIKLNTPSGVIKFEGEFLDDKKVKGTEYDKNGDIKYQYNNINGIGKELGYFCHLKENI